MTNHSDPRDVRDLMAFLDDSPSPYHVVASAASRLEDAGFHRVAEADNWTAATRAYAVRGGALIAWAQPNSDAALPRAPFRIVGAHTDSPGLRVKPRPDTASAGWRQIAVEVYGGALLNSWLDRDLGVAGRVISNRGDEFLVDLREPLARVPQLAIHLDRDVNERGLVLDKQQHLTPVWGTGAARPGEFIAHLAQRSGVVSADDIAAWDLSLYDLTRASLLGADSSLLASGRLDNQLSCWAAIAALAAARPALEVQVVALFDHEEVGSESTTGAAGPFLEHVLERLALARGASRDDFLRSLSASSCISADNAHAVHPNYPERHEPGHRPMVNQGPAIKVNANQRYATSATTALLFEESCRRADVPVQSFVSRNNMPCGSTIGPITATRLGIPTVDIGIPQLSMHSARELCGVDDPGYLVRALTEYFSS